VDLAAAHDLDVWTKYAAPGRPVRVRVQSDDERELVTSTFHCTTAIADLYAIAPLTLWQRNGTDLTSEHICLPWQ